MVAVAGVVVAADQVTKTMAENGLASGPTHLLGPLDLELSFNSGAAFSIGRGVTPIVVVAAAVMLVFLFRSSRQATSPLWWVASGLVVGGAVSNLVDRIVRHNDGAVVDFIHLPHWPTFNVADSCIVVGIGLMLVVGVLNGEP